MNGFTIQILIDCWGISHLLFIGQKKVHKRLDTPSQFICEDEFSSGGHASRMLLTSLRSKDEEKI